MSGHSKGGRMDLYYKNDLPNGSASTGSIVDRADGLVAAEVYGATPEACDALGRKMAASGELVEAVRRALWHVTGDSEERLSAAVEEYERTTGQTARAFVGHTTAFHLWCEKREAEDAAFLRAALKKAGVEP